MCRKLTQLVAIVLVVASASHADLIIGDFEGGMEEGWGPTWEEPAPTFTYSTTGATLGETSLAMQPNVNGWQWAFMYEGLIDLTLYQTLSVDVTWVAEEWGDTPWCNFKEVAVNSDGPSGWAQYIPDDPINPDWPGSWDPANWGDQTRTLTWDFSSYDATGATWMQIVFSVNFGGNTPGKYYIDNVRFVSSLMASNPNPADGATDVPVTQLLSWRPGAKAVSHDVYFGADPNTLTAAVIDSNAPVQYANVDVPQFDPGTLDFNTTYYWRVDEVNENEPNGLWVGDAWTFTTGNFIAIDDFESYNDNDKMIFETWIDGFVNGTGSIVGHLDPPYAEQEIVHTGSQSMPLAYDDFVAPHYSEATRQFGEPQDWVQLDGQMLTVWVYGDIVNASEPMFIGVADGGGAVAYALNEELELVSTLAWQRWDIDLSVFSDGGADLSAVNEVSVGVGNPVTPVSGYSGRIFVDDIWLELNPPDAG